MHFSLLQNAFLLTAECISPYCIRSLKDPAHHIPNQTEIATEEFCPKSLLRKQNEIDFIESHFQILHHLKIVHLVHFFVALFLWSRQQAFFANRLLNFNYNKLIKCFSFVIIAVIVAYGIFVVALNSAPKFYTSSSMGCVLRPGYEVQVATWLTPLVGKLIQNVCFVSH